MDCKLIFYAARKTAFCEHAVQKSFSELNLTLSGTAFATESVQLGNLLTEDFRKCDVVFVIGGLGLDDCKNAEKIFSKALTGAGIDEYKKLKNNFGEDGYVFKAGKQILTLLPDEPQQIELIMQGPLRGYIKKKKITRV